MVRDAADSVLSVSLKLCQSSTNMSINVFRMELILRVWCFYCEVEEHKDSFRADMSMESSVCRRPERKMFKKSKYDTNTFLIPDIVYITVSLEQEWLYVTKNIHPSISDSDITNVFLSRLLHRHDSSFALATHARLRRSHMEVGGGREMLPCRKRGRCSDPSVTLLTVEC